MKKNLSPVGYLRAIRAYEVKMLRHRPLSLRVADKLSGFFGTARFFVYLVIANIIWITINLGLIPGITPFDPYPFILLTMIASVGAIFLTVIVLISQNRQGHINTLRNELLLQMILIAERELTKALQIIVNMGKRSRIHGKQDPELTEMLKTTDVDWIEKKLEEQLNGKNY